MLPNLDTAPGPGSPSQSLLSGMSIRNRAGELGIVLLGKFGLMGANGALTLLLAQYLDLNVYGVVVAAIGAQVILGRMLVMGVDGGLIRLRTLPELRDRSREIAFAGLVLVLGSSALFALCSLAASPAIKFSASPGWSGWILASVVAGSAATALVDYHYSYRLARLQYWPAVRLQGGTAFGRLALTAMPLFLLPHYPFAVLIAYPCAGLLAGVGHTAALFWNERPRFERRLLGRLLRYSLWQGGADVSAMLSLYIGNFILILLSRPKEAGLFGFALMLSMVFFAIFNAFNEYLYSRIGGIDSLTALRRFLKRSYGAAFFLILACVPVVLAVAWLVPRFLRPELAEAVPVFYCLCSAMLVLIAQSPLKSAAHYILKPRLLVLSAVLRLVLMAVIGLVLATDMGAMGMAVAQLGGAVGGLAGLAVLLAVELRAAHRVSEAVLVEG